VTIVLFSSRQREDITEEVLLDNETVIRKDNRRDSFSETMADVLAKGMAMERSY
jgi:hypothetical protein